MTLDRAVTFYEIGNPALLSGVSYTSSIKPSKEIIEEIEEHEKSPPKNSSQFLVPNFIVKEYIADLLISLPHKKYSNLR